MQCVTRHSQLQLLPMQREQDEMLPSCTWKKVLQERQEMVLTGTEVLLVLVTLRRRGCLSGMHPLPLLVCSAHAHCLMILAGQAAAKQTIVYNTNYFSNKFRFFFCFLNKSLELRSQWNWKVRKVNHYLYLFMALWWFYISLFRICSLPQTKF